MNDMIPTEEWLEECKKLPSNQRRSIYHGCSSKKKTLYIYNNDDSWSCYCHKCHKRGYVSKGRLSIDNALRGKADEELTNYIRREIKIPDNSNTDYSPRCMVWLVSNGISPDTANTYGFKYHPESDRLLMPIYNRRRDRLLAIQARAITDGVVPKYLNTSGVPSGTALFWSITPKHSKILVLLEDIASTIKVGSVTQAVSLLGTKMSNKQLQDILAYGAEEIVVWLDSDEAGEVGADIICKQLALVGVKHRKVVTASDPKKQSRNLILEKLNG